MNVGELYWVMLRDRKSDKPFLTRIRVEWLSPGGRSVHLKFLDCKGSPIEKMNTGNAIARYSATAKEAIDRFLVEMAEGQFFLKRPKEQLLRDIYIAVRWADELEQETEDDDILSPDEMAWV